MSHMKTILFLVCLMFVGCAEGSTEPGESNAQPTPQTTVSIADSGAQKDTSVEDAGIDTRPPPYVSCATEEDIPTSYPRLTERHCTDSNGVAYVRGYLDGALGIDCRWGMAADLKVRCLPENQQSSPEYADDLCQDAIALVVVNHTVPLANYIGLETYVGDGGTNYTTVYNLGKVWHGDIMYYNSLEGDTWVCNPTYLAFPGTALYYVGSEVNPSTFVAK